MTPDRALDCARIQSSARAIGDFEQKLFDYARASVVASLKWAIRTVKNAAEAITTEMHISISLELLKPFWAQLFRNIGYSIEYKRYVIVEPICYLAEYAPSTFKCVPVDPLVFDFDPGPMVASFIDAESDDYVEQALVPYILSEKYTYILITDNPITFSKDRLPEFLNYLKQNPQITRKVRGLIHYHVDEPRLSEGDIEAMTRYTHEIGLLGGGNQIGIVLSEKDPSDTFEVKKSGERKFIKHLSTKLRMRRIDVIGQSFTGRPDSHSPLEIGIDL